MDKIGIFTPTKLESSIEIQQIVTLHYFAYAKDFKFNGEKHDFWEIAYVDRGEVGIATENSAFELRQGEAVFHKPNEYHSIWANNKYANVVVLSFVCNSAAMSFFENKILRFNSNHQSLIANIIALGEACFVDPLNDIYQTMLVLNPEAPFGCAQMLKNYIELLLLYLIRDNTDIPCRERLSGPAKSKGEAHIAEALKQYLAEHIYDAISLSDVIREVSFSKSYISKLFYRHTGVSVMDYYMNLRIAEASRLISERELSFTEIADKLGFNSIHYFSKMFKKKTGMTPSDYKKSVRSKGIL